MIRYTPPTPADLQRLKSELGYTGEKMAELVSVSGGQQWRKYTGGAQPREVNLHMLFFIAARLTLDAEQLRAVAARMVEAGADIDVAALLAKP
jgi:predicted transcriptional regulator